MTTLREPLAEPLGKKAGDTLEKVFGLRTVGDLLRHYPRRYYTRGELTPLDSLTEGDHVTVVARVELSTVAGAYGGRAKGGRGPAQRLEVIVTDGTGKLQLAFFAGVHFHAKQLQPGVLALFAGTVSSFRGRRQLVHPEYELLPAAMSDERMTTELAEDFANELIPVYPASAKLTSWTISKYVGVVLDGLDAGGDPLSPEIRERHRLWPRELALRAIHRPTGRDELHGARKRLKWDEAFTMQAALAQRRHLAAAMPAVPRPPVPDGIAAAFERRLPFTLTEGQQAVGAVIEHDLACACPMNRLLQGEVGSGKTIVAVRAMLQVVDAGGQAALLAPTEVLAQQHYRSITALLGPLGQSGQLGLDQADPAEGGQADPGGPAHRLDRRARAAVDAERRVHRRRRHPGRHARAARGPGPVRRPGPGGHRRAAPLRRRAARRAAGEGGRRPAARAGDDRDPDPAHGGDDRVRRPRGIDPVRAARRPLADRDPRGARGGTAALPGPGLAAGARGGRRGPPGLRGVPADRRRPTTRPTPGPEPEAAAAAAEGSPAPPKTARARRPPLAVLDVAPELAEGPLAGLRIGVMHGRLVPDEKDRVMTAFAAGELDVLVSTTVIEVGVDVPNATAMVILDAERFGVSQLHQLRGRVGRGRYPGLCLLVTEAEPDGPSRERLDAVAETGDGFQLSRLDLQQRREGDVLGSAQAGRRSSLKLLRLLEDEDLIGAAREEATALVAADPELSAHPALREAIDDFLGDRRAEFLDKA